MEAYLRLAVLGAILAGLGFAEYKVYEAGYHSAQAVYEAQLQAIKDASAAEQAKEASANQQALQAAGEAIAKLQDQVTDAQQDAEDAAADANAKHPALGLASVRRLNHSSSN